MNETSTAAVTICYTDRPTDGTDLVNWIYLWPKASVVVLLCPFIHPVRLWNCFVGLFSVMTRWFKCSSARSIDKVVSLSLRVEEQGIDRLKCNFSGGAAEGRKFVGLFAQLSWHSAANCARKEVQMNIDVFHGRGECVYGFYFSSAPVTTNKSLHCVQLCRYPTCPIVQHNCSLFFISTPDLGQYLGLNHTSHAIREWAFNCSLFGQWKWRTTSTFYNKFNLQIRISSLA